MAEADRAGGLIMTVRAFFKVAKHCTDWLLARLIMGIAGVAFIGAIFIGPAMLAELLCKVVGLA